MKIHPTHTTDRIFYLSIGLALLNLLLVTFILPESVSTEERQRRAEQAAAAREQKRLEGAGFLRSVRDSIVAFFSPLALFLPKTRGGEVHWSDYKDWNLTCLAIAMFCYLLTLVSSPRIIASRFLTGRFSGPIPAQVCLCAEGLPVGLHRVGLLYLCHGRRPSFPPALCPPP